MSKSEDLYLAAPEWLQQLMVKSYGYKLYRKRYGGSYRDILALIRESKDWTPQRIYQYQCENLTRIALYCSENIPFYQRQFADYGISPNQIDSPEKLRKLPVLDKETLRKRASEFLPTDHSRTYTVQHTSGSTGTPLALHTDETTYKLAMALLVDFEETNGVPFGAPRATFGGRMLKRSEKMKPPFWRYNKAENQLLFSSYHINSKTFPYYARKLNAFQPMELIGYPSAICELATQYLESGTVPGFHPRLIVTNSENLLEWQRHRIEAAFQCDVKDYYSTAEYLNFAGEDAAGRYRSSPLIGITEIEPLEGEPEQVGNLVMTTLTNVAMPLLRYRIGDVGTLSENGNSTPGAPVLAEVEGRIDDFLDTKDGRRIGRVSQVFKGLPGIKEAQIFQEKAGWATLRVVRDESGTDNEEQLVRNAQARLGNDFRFRIEYREFIPRGKNGKFRFVIKAKHPSSELTIDPPDYEEAGDTRS